MRHAFMQGIAEELAHRGLATFRYQFPYMEQGGRRPNPRPVLWATVRSAIATAADAAGDLPLLAGGKSMGGRMTSMAAAETELPDVRGIVFLGFPLHPAGKPSTERADHLQAVTVPMLFLQGTRDRLAELELLRPICLGLGPRATLRVIDSADHSFRVPRSSDRSDGEVLREIAESVQGWAARLS
jgi:predicted alpha/beta-hydrolase family hydrolase